MGATLNMGEAIYICAAKRMSQTALHIARSMRVRDHSGAATNHITNDTALCGENVTEFYPFQSPLPTIQANDSRVCVDCASRFMQTVADESITKRQAKPPAGKRKLWS